MAFQNRLVAISNHSCGNEIPTQNILLRGQTSRRTCEANVSGWPRECDNIYRVALSHLSQSLFILSLDRQGGPIITDCNLEEVPRMEINSERLQRGFESARRGVSILIEAR